LIPIGVDVAHFAGDLKQEHEVAANFPKLLLACARA
jgi:hypothetical protein